MFVMVLCARAYDIQTGICRGILMRCQIPDGLVESVAENTVWACSRRNVADGTVLLHILGRSLVHGVLRDAKDINEVTN